VVQIDHTPVDLMLVDVCTAARSAGPG